MTSSYITFCLLESRHLRTCSYFFVNCFSTSLLDRRKINGWIIWGGGEQWNGLWSNNCMKANKGWSCRSNSKTEDSLCVTWWQVYGSNPGSPRWLLSLGNPGKVWKCLELGSAPWSTIPSTCCAEGCQSGATGVGCEERSLICWRVVIKQAATANQLARKKIQLMKRKHIQATHSRSGWLFLHESRTTSANQIYSSCILPFHVGNNIWPGEHHARMYLGCPSTSRQYRTPFQGGESLLAQNEVSKPPPQASPSPWVESDTEGRGGQSQRNQAPGRIPHAPRLNDLHPQQQKHATDQFYTLRTCEDWTELPSGSLSCFWSVASRQWQGTSTAFSWRLGSPWRAACMMWCTRWNCGVPSTPAFKKGKKGKHEDKLQFYRTVQQSEQRNPVQRPSQGLCLNSNPQIHGC